MSSKKDLWQIRITVDPEAEDAVAVFLEEKFGVAPAIYTNIEKQISSLSCYTEKALLRDVKEEAIERVKQIEACGLRTTPSLVKVEKVKREDWSESWKKYFKAIEIEQALIIKPSWSKRKPVKGQQVVVLDPGLSFGTGQHATTSFCLWQIVACRPKDKPKSLLDIGSGSGILSIAAAKLGFQPVIGFDFDPVAVRVAQKNCRKNRVGAKVQITRKDLLKLPLHSRTRFDIVCANLIDDLLLQQRDKILNRLAEKGMLVLAGILATQFKAVQNAYEDAGLELVKTKIEREWQSGAFRRK